MRDEEFKQRLSQVANWHMQRCDKEGKGSYKKKSDPDVPEHLVVTGLKYQAQPCEDCGNIVQGRRKDIRIYRYGQTNARKEHCLTCDRHKDPYTGEFTCDSGTVASRLWLDYARYNKHNKTKKTHTEEEKV